ncbi:hypothetical protein [Nevskia soli]|uniref:hypothetical protein n=1 Tax=Nevskia soli TaxID=418856 RepID=UPI0004A735B5|nr:hypothetical protein [Nevskia soli]
MRRSAPTEFDQHFTGLKDFLSGDGQQVPHEIRIDHKSLKVYSRIKSTGNGRKFGFENRLLG